MSATLAVVMAAGKGTRMKSELPKVLVPVCGRPMIDYVIDAMAAASDGLPTRFVWFIFLGLTIIGAGALVIVLSHSMVAAAATMAATIGFWFAVGNGLMPGWIIFVFVPIAGILILVRPGKLTV